LDKPFDLYTDNAAAAYLFEKKDPYQRLERWILAISEFSFIIKHLPGKENVVADAMSRFPPDYTLIENNGQEEMAALYDHLLLENTNYEESLHGIYNYLLKVTSLGDSRGDPKLKITATKYKLHQNHLYKKLNDRFVKIPF
jgi:hypothetical protein